MSFKQNASKPIGNIALLNSSERKKELRTCNTQTEPLFRTQNGKLHAFQSKPTWYVCMYMRMYIVHRGVCMCTMKSHLQFIDSTSTMICKKN